MTQYDTDTVKRKKMWKPGRILFLLLFILLLFGGWFFYQQKVNVVTVFPVSMLKDDWWKDYDMYTGSVTNSMSQEVFSTEGRAVDDVYVEAGQQVKAGDILLTFEMEEETIELELKEAELKEAQLALSYASSEEKEELEHNVKQLQLEYETLKKQVEEATVKASIDGVIKSVNAAGVAQGTPVLVLTSEDKLYVQGVIDEFNYASVKTGSLITAVSWDTGNSFQARITEISPYPASKDDYQLGEGHNPNVSCYPFTAVIVDTLVDVEAGESVNVSFDGISQKMFLPLAYVRSEGSKSYVYVRGGGNRLEKRYVTTGQSMYNTVIEIKDGLESDDYIAFPYGKNVREGAGTVISKDTSDFEY